MDGKNAGVAIINLLNTESAVADVVGVVPPIDAALVARLFARSLLCHGVGCVRND